jgi:probable phosphoglycerate mutase
VERWGTGWKELDLGLESPELAEQRGRQAIEELAERHPGQNILVVSHGAVLRHTLRGLVPALDVTELLKNTSITRIVKNDGVWSCELYNCAAHLENQA